MSIYIYIGARDLNGAPFGTHQFIILTYDRAQPYIPIGFSEVSSRPLGKNIHGVVIGAHNKESLTVKFFEEADFNATLEYFGVSKTTWYKSDYDTELSEVKFTSLSENEAKKRIIRLIENYIFNQKTDPIRYPTLGIGVNSNSWAQSIIKYSGDTVNSNMTGLDISNSKRVPRTYFDGICPILPREKVN